MSCPVKRLLRIIPCPVAEVLADLAFGKAAHPIVWRDTTTGEWRSL